MSYIADNPSDYAPEQKRNYIEQKNRKSIVEQIKSNGFSEPLGDIPWIHHTSDNNGKIKTKVLCPALADYIRKNSHYIFARNDAIGSVMRYLYLDGYYKHVSDEEMKGFIKQFIPLPYQKMSEITEVLQLLYTDPNFRCMEELNPENLINFENGVLNTDTWELEPHSPNYLCTIQIPCNYIPDVCPTITGYFDRFMTHLSNEDKEVEKLLLQFLGVCISNVPGYRMKKAMFMVGNGDTGKSTFKELAVRLVGERNSSAIDLQELENNKFGTSQLYNKRLAGANDMSYATVSEMKILKLATGGDTLHAEFKGQNGFNFRFKGVLWFCCNEMPRFGGDRGQWVYDRLIIVTCNNPVIHKDKSLLEKMYSERDYIISRAIDGLKQVIQNGYEYNIPKCCAAKNSEYQVENNSFLRFVRECTIQRSEREPDRCTRAHIYKAYSAWCKTNNGGYAEPKKEAFAELERRGITANKIGGDYYFPFTLSREIKKEYVNICGFLGRIDEEQKEEIPFGAIGA